MLKLAQKQDVAVFTVGLGDVNGSYLRHIAQSTGGKYIAAESSTELGVFTAFSSSISSTITALNTR